jgi:hypothetical protein
MHEWDGTRLRFQQGPDGNTWGAYVDLEGPPGKDGKRREVYIGAVGAASNSGASSGDSGGGMAAGVPLYIAPGETFTAPANQQTLFAMTIDCEGFLNLEGFLVAVS